VTEESDAAGSGAEREKGREVAPDLSLSCTQGQARIPRVKLRFSRHFLPVVLLTSCLLGIIGAAIAQDAAVARDAASVAPQIGVMVTRLSPPTYPPIARMARIVGDVKVQLKIRQDGAVESAQVVSGRALLKQAALDSAQKSTYECQN
jgi:TonB family protein